MTRVETIGDCTLYLGDCRDILPTLGPVDALVTDPPYGMNATTANMAGGTGRWALASAESAWPDRLDWDDESPKVVAELAGRWPSIIWGGQFHALPTARGWLVWNKIIRNWSASECELAWTNIEIPVRAFDCSHGQLASEGKSHPTQKPLELMKWCLGFLPDARVVLDPFMGSGTTGVACVLTDRAFIGIEREPSYFDIACRRIEEAYRQPRLFAEPEPKPVQEALDLTA